MDDESLLELIGLLMRYQLDMSVLASQCSELNQHWFKNPQTYWHQRVFGAPRYNLERMIEAITLDNQHPLADFMADRLQ